MSDMALATAEPHGKVLYIEDNPINFAVVEAGLACLPGVQLIHAATGLEGVRMVRAERPDFVLLDMRLGDISGLEVVRMISEDIAARRLRVTILTGARPCRTTLPAPGGWPRAQPRVTAARRPR